MATALALSILVAAIFWLAVIAPPIRPTSTREKLDAADSEPSTASVSVTALIPARNEATTISRTLTSLCQQGGELAIIVIDDQSTDATAEIVANHPGRIRLINGTPTPAGWLGKVWALEQGLAAVETPLVLMLDADIELSPGLLGTLQEKLEREQLGLISLMARLRIASAWERLLVPAYIYFFKLLYPFKLVNARTTSVAAAAGGCILIRKAVLSQIGGFGAIRGAIIDDCALAGLVKRAGHPIWLGLTHSASSMRAYDGLTDLWHLVARSAFAELRFSVTRLLICTTAMILLFCMPIVGAIVSTGSAFYASILALVFMLTSYLPVLRFYSLNPARCLTLPLVAIGYLAMTWGSALRYLSGKPTIWKNRAYRDIGEY